LLVQQSDDFLLWRWCIGCLAQTNTGAGLLSSLWLRLLSLISPRQSLYSHNAQMFARSGTRLTSRGNVGVRLPKNTRDFFKDVRSSWASKRVNLLMGGTNSLQCCNWPYIDYSPWLHLLESADDHKGEAWSGIVDVSQHIVRSWAFPKADLLEHQWWNCFRELL
jgi:hypothetical protein